MHLTNVGPFEESIVSAAPGFRVHYLSDKKPFTNGPGEAIIAWVVQTFPRGSRGDPVRTYVTPVPSGGQALDLAFLIEQPDGTVVHPDGAVLTNLAMAVAAIEAQDSESETSAPASAVFVR